MAVRSHGSCLFLERKSVFYLGVPCCALLGSKSARQVGWCQLGTWVASEQWQFSECSLCKGSKRAALEKSNPLLRAGLTGSSHRAP